MVLRRSPARELQLTPPKHTEFCLLILAMPHLNSLSFRSFRAEDLVIPARVDGFVHHDAKQCGRTVCLLVREGSTTVDRITVAHCPLR